MKLDLKNARLVHFLRRGALAAAIAGVGCSRATSTPAPGSDQPTARGQGDNETSESQAGAGPGEVVGTSDASAERDCIQTENPSICAPIVRCSACDGGLCGEAPQLGGCDLEGAVCVGACDVPCTCNAGFWRCDYPVGQPCHHPSCTYPANYTLGGVSVFQCCTSDAGASVWANGACEAR